MNIQTLSKECKDFLQRILESSITDERIPKDRIGEEKEYKWRASSINHEPILINNASGKMVAGVGKEARESTGKSDNKQRAGLIAKVADSARKYKDFKQAIVAMEKEGIHLKGFEKLAKYNYTYTAKVANAMRTFKQEFPEYDIDLQLWNTPIPPTGSFMSVQAALMPEDIYKANYSMYIVGGHLSGKDCFMYQTKSMKSDCTYMGEGGYHPKNTTSESSVYHELWHALCNQMIRKAYDKQIRQLQTQYDDRNFLIRCIRLRAPKTNALCMELVNEALGGNLMPYEIHNEAAKICVYAAERNANETIAEACCDVYANGENAHENSKKIYAMVKKYAKKSPEEIKKIADRGIPNW